MKQQPLFTWGKPTVGGVHEHRHNGATATILEIRDGLVSYRRKRLGKVENRFMGVPEFMFWFNP